MQSNIEHKAIKDETVTAPAVLVIEAKQRQKLIDWRELNAFRDLLYFLTWRQIKVRYAQSAVGIGWAILQPLVTMVVFTIIFGNLAKISSEGSPYALFSLAALLPWTYFSNSVTDGVSSLVSEANTLRKVYFPRVLIPLASILAKLLDLGIACCLMAVLMLFYKQAPNLWLLIMPILLVLMICSALGLSLWLSALAIQYRDVKHGLNFFIQLAMYACPIVYPTTAIPESYRLIYALNPMVAIVEGFRSGLLGTNTFQWSYLACGFATTTLVLLTGLKFFRAREIVFADVA